MRSLQDLSSRSGATARLVGGVCVAMLASGTASAQTVNDLNPAPPNVLLLIDDSGDMQYRMQDTKYPQCNVAADPDNEYSRWAVLTEALTGTINQYGCSAGPNGTVFSNRCVSMPNMAVEALYLGEPATDWPTVPLAPPNAKQPIVFQQCDSSGNNCIPLCNVGPGSPGSASWDQANDGILQTFGQQVRFGLMTLDDQFEEETDNSGLPPAPVYWAPGSYQPLPSGGYSYWNTVSGAPPSIPGPPQIITTAPFSLGVGAWVPPPGAYSGYHQGRYYKSSNILDWEVGARNQNARPWQGRLMGFGSSNDPKVFSAQNDRVRLAVLGNHPQWTLASTSAPGSTILTPDKVIRAPIAPLMADAYDFLAHDNSAMPYPTPSDPPFRMGLVGDPLLACRQTTVVLISGGLVNFDMRNPSDGWPCPGGGATICNTGNACKCDGHKNCAHEKCPIPGATAPGCVAQCNGGSQCPDLVCDGANCANAQCSGHSTCGVSCQATFTALPLPGTTTPANCSGYHCSGHSNCSLDCSPQLGALAGSNCSAIHCDGDSQCLVNCGLLPNALCGGANITCDDGSLTNCGGGIWVCNRSCPNVLNHCGDGFCDRGIESCSSCPQDCGSCVGVSTCPNASGVCDACDAPLQSCATPSETGSPAQRGACPYDTGNNYANDLKALTPSVKTYVIGLGQQQYDLKTDPSNNPDPLFVCPSAWTLSGSDCTGACSDLTAVDFSAHHVCDGSSENWVQSQNGGDDPSPCCELWNIANSGGAKAYFPGNSLEMKSALSQILTQAAGGPTSRTQPTFAVRAPTIVASFNPITAPASSPASYEMLSSFTPLNVGSTTWTGNLERRRLVCTGGASPVPQNTTRANGDELGDTLVQFRTTRKFFTAVPRTGQPSDVLKTLRRSDVSYQSTFPGDLLGTVDGLTQPLNQTQLATAGDGSPLPTGSRFADKIDAALGGTLQVQDILGINWTKDKLNCQDLTATDSATCARKTLIWLGGDRNALPSDRVPRMYTDGSATGVTTCPVGQLCSPLGAIFHSTPVISGPPLDAIRDESYRQKFAVDQQYRPTVTYAASIDGLLHAFVIENNSLGFFTTGTPQAYDSLVPKTDGSQNTELWSFAPPAVLPSIWPNFNANARLLDGALAISDVVPFRTVAQAESGTTSADGWRTILVGSSGLSAEGGFYYALDVTDPLTPAFLWQLRTDSGGSPLFGKGTPGAAIATVGVNDPLGAGVDQLAVAILPGGTSASDPPSAVTARHCSSCSGSACNACPSPAKARTTIRDWGSSDPSRSVTIVELATGRIIKRFVGLGSGVTPGGDLPAISQRALASFDSPMSGTPIAFPNTPGTAASRVYIGDSDGTMWRLDLSNPDTTKWNASIAFDPYVGQSPTAGQRIEVPPILSTDPAENPVVMFATGDQEGFAISTPGMKNYLISMTDKPGAGFNTFNATADVVVPLQDGERVTGPLALFNGNIYFSTYVPNTAPTPQPGLTLCQPGFARIWGINYLLDTLGPKNVGAGPTDPANGLDTTGTGAKPNARFVNVTDAMGNVDATSVIFGVGINRLPSCITTTNTFSDSWLAGSYQTQAAQASSYELIAQTGQATSGATALGGEKLLSGGQQGASTNAMHVNLAPPPTTVHVESWTTLTE